MLGGKRNRHECAYGCCRSGLSKASERRVFRSREKRAWKKEEA